MTITDERVNMLEITIKRLTTRIEFMESRNRAADAIMGSISDQVRKLEGRMNAHDIKTETNHNRLLTRISSLEGHRG